MSTQEIKSLLPYGYQKLVAEKAGVTAETVSRHFTGKTNSVKVEMAALEILAALNTKKQTLTQKLK